MVSYFYEWAPLAIVGTVVLLSLPWLGLIALIALLIVSLVLLAALASAIAAVPYTLGRAIRRRWQGIGHFNWGVRRTRSVPAGATVLLANPPPQRETCHEHHEGRHRSLR
jgi:hypothetical protein